MNHLRPSRRPDANTTPARPERCGAGWWFSAALLGAPHPGGVLCLGRWGLTLRRRGSRPLEAAWAYDGRADAVALVRVGRA